MLSGKSYTKVNAPQRLLVKNFLLKYCQLEKWDIQKSKNIMDVGCGTGDVTAEILLPHLSQNVDQILGIDKDKGMIEYARINFPHEKVDYFYMDITGNTRPEFKGKFDCIFSFYCLNWLKDYRKAVYNINQYLKPGGLFFTIFLADSSHYPSHTIMAAQKKWDKYMTNYEEYMIRYHNHDNPEIEFSRLLALSNFDVQKCEVEKFSYRYDSIDEMRDFFSATNPIILNIPAKLHDVYWEEFFSHMENNSKFPPLFDEEKKCYFFHLESLIAIATKCETL